jgi:DnaJ-class molecular chaperone
MRHPMEDKKQCSNCNGTGVIVIGKNFDGENSTLQCPVCDDTTSISPKILYPGCV